MADRTPGERIRLLLPDLPPRLRGAARFLVEHQFEATTSSMRDLASAAQVTPATFSRLVRSLGYDGWEDMRGALVEQHRPQPFSSRVTQPGRSRQQDLPGGMLAADAAALGTIDAGPVHAAAKALHRAPRIWVAGFRSCHAVASLLDYQLRLFRPGEVRLVGATGAEDLDIGSFRRGDVVVLTSFAPYSRAALMVRDTAHAQACPLVVITDTRLSPLAEGAAHLLLFGAADGPGFFPSLTGAVALAQALAATVFTLGGEAALIRLREAEERLASVLQRGRGE